MATIMFGVEDPWSGVMQWTEDMDYKQTRQALKDVRSNLEKKG